MIPSVLGGIRVLDLGGSVAAPYAARLLASLGAEVVHVRTSWDDPLVAEGPFPAGSSGDTAGLFQWLNAGKRVVALDPGSPTDRAAITAAVREADIVLVSASPRTVDAAGFAPEDLARLNPRIASVHVSPFGRTGPYRDVEATDLLAYLAFARFADCGLRGQPPIGHTRHAAELFAGTLAATAAVAALRHARQRGSAVHADLAVADCVFASPDRAFALYAFHGAALSRAEAHREVFFYTADGTRMFINTGLSWERTVALIDRPDLLDDPRFTTLAERVRHADEVYALLVGWALERTPAEIMDALGEHRVLGGPMLAPWEVLADRQYVARQFFHELAVPGAPPARVPGIPYLVNGERPVLAPAEVVPAIAWTPRPAGLAAHLADPGAMQPLAGLRVIDLGELYAGPSACSLLGDLGADVIKVENVNRMPAVVRGDRHPPEGAFGYYRSHPGERPWERFHLFHTVERNKRGVTLDLKHAEGRALFLDLVAQVDVVISNYTPRALRQLRLEARHLHAVNPRLTFVHLPGFGADGPYADHVSVGPVAEAVSGHWAARGYPDAPPLQSNQTVWADAVAAATASLLAVASVVHGPRASALAYDLSQAEAMTCFVAQECLEHQWNGATAGPLGDKHPAMAPHGCYATAGEDRWVALAARTDAEWVALAAAIGRPDLACAPGLATLAGRKAREAEIDAAIAAWASPLEQRAAAAALQAAGIPAVAVLADDDLAQDPQVRAREMLVTVEHAAVGSYETTATPLRFNGVPRVRRRPPNLLGEHNAEVLGGWLGLSPERLKALAAARVIGTTFGDD